MNSKIYSIKLKKYDPFIIYYDTNNVARLITDRKHPLPPTESTWAKGQSAFLPANSGLNIVSCTSVKVKKEEYDDFIFARIEELVKISRSIINGEYNYLFLEKQLEDDCIQSSGIIIYNRDGMRHDKKKQKMLDKIYNLRAFW